MTRLFWKVYLPLAACVVLTLVLSVVAIIEIIPAQLNDYRDKVEELREYLASSWTLHQEEITSRAEEIGLDVRVTPGRLMHQPRPPDGFMRIPGIPESYPFVVETSIAPRGGPGGFLRQGFWLVLLLLLVMEGLVLYLALWPLRKRLTRLGWAASEVGAGNLGVRLEIREPGDFIDALSSTFNRMAGEIDTLIASHRELLGIVAHELRTPLARMQLALELIREDSGGGDLSKVERMERDLAELDSLVTELLAFNRLGRIGEIAREPVALGCLCTEAAEAEAWSSGDISVEVAGEAEVRGDRALLGRAVANLVRNAITHAVSRVEVRVAPRGSGGAMVIVSDDGPGYDPGIMDRLGEPFVKGRAGSGVGLGLAIASRIAVLHGGGLSFDRSTSLGGAEAGLSIGGRWTGKREPSPA